MKASLQQQPMYCSRDHNYTSRLNQQYEKSTQKITGFGVFYYVMISFCVKIEICVGKPHNLCIPCISLNKAIISSVVTLEYVGAKS